MVAQDGASDQRQGKWKEVGHPPFTFQDGRSGPCPEFPSVCRTVLGSHISHRFAGEAAATDVVPRQMTSLLLDGMLALKTKYEDPTSRVSEAKRCSEWALELSKRARA